MHSQMNEVEANLVNTCAELLKTVIQAARVRDHSLADALAQLHEVRLVIQANGPDLEINLLTPAEDGGTLRIYGLTATENEACSLH